MTLTFALAIYVICWWMTLFTILPIGVRSQEEVGDVTPGTEPGAPVLPNIGRKLLWTTFISLIVFAIIYVVIEYRLIDIDAVPIGI